MNNKLLHPKLLPIKGAVCAYFDVTPEELDKPNRERPIARVRQLAMYLCRELTNASLPEIGRAFKRDHTTAKSNIALMEKELPKSEALKLAHKTISHLFPGATR